VGPTKYLYRHAGADSTGYGDAAKQGEWYFLSDLTQGVKALPAHRHT
jgi:hypothetical protein